MSPLRAIVLPLLAVLLSTGCVSLRASHLAHLSAVSGPQPEAAKALSVEQRRAQYDAGRLRWDGTQVQVGQDSLGRASVQAYLRVQGAPDLAAAMDHASPAYSSWRREHGPLEQSASAGVNAGRWLDGGNGSGDEALVGVLAAVALAGTAGATAYVAGDSLLRGIGSELNPKPCLEDVLEAYNQRQAHALGLDAGDGALVTCMPSWSGVSGREHGRANRLVRTGMAAGLGAMVAATAAAWIELGNGRPLPAWAAPVFGMGAGGLAAFWAVGWSYAW